MPPAKRAASFRSQKSQVEALDVTGNVFKGFTVWTNKSPWLASHPEQLFVKCVVLPGSTRLSFRLRQIQPTASDEEFEVPAKYIFNCNANIDPMTYGDIGKLPHTNPPCVLDFLAQRFARGQIYTEADPLLVAINPFKDLGNTTQQVVVQYRDAPDVSRLDPHVFAVARVALENLHSVQKSQTIIVSGESGAGKTEATKQIMRYFAAAKSGSIDTRIQTSVLAANPVLEAFGNAKTIRNNNSSRFGRFMQLAVAPTGGIEYGSIRNFLLEKSRIVTQDSQERTYHIYYFMCKGASEDERRKYHLRPLSEYKLINTACHDAAGIDDVAEWHEVIRSLRSMQHTQEEIDSIMRIISGVVLLGNVEIVGREKARITAESRPVFLEACSLLSIDPKATEEGMTVRISKAGEDVVHGYWGEREANVYKLSLAKATYEKLFQWIVDKLNLAIQPPQGFQRFMGMLDIFGFEVFVTNSLEQFFINITNEMLQKNFIDIVFERETKLYRAEGISDVILDWTTNKEVIDLLTSKRMSLMTCLEDQCLSPGSADEKFLNSAYTSLKGNDRLLPGRTSPNQNFIVVHTIGPIQYNSTGFLEKNKDVLRAELMEVVQQSPHPIVGELFRGIYVERGKLAKGQLIGSQFMKQLDQLMELINSTEPHFIRCVKPNELKAPLLFHNDKVIVQLKALSVLEALELRNLAYSYRRPFDEFLRQFKFVDLGIAESKSEDRRELARQLIEVAKISPDLWAIGKTMVFMKRQGVKDMGKCQREAMALWEPLIARLEAMILRKYAQEAVDAVTPAVVRLQAHVRRHIAAQ